jgi:hypothetical protein
VLEHLLGFFPRPFFGYLYTTFFLLPIFAISISICLFSGSRDRAKRKVSIRPEMNGDVKREQSL